MVEIHKNRPETIVVADKKYMILDGHGESRLDNGRNFHSQVAMGEEHR